MTAIKKDCSTCYHFMKKPSLDLTSKTGQCHRYPPNAMPIMTPKGPQVMAEFTPTNSDWFCGEWQADIMANLGKG